MGKNNRAVAGEAEGWVVERVKGGSGEVVWDRAWFGLGGDRVTG